MIYLICLICWTCQFIQGYPEAKALAHTFQYLYLQKSNRANCCDACTASCNEARERFFSWCSILLLLLLIALAACLTTQCISEFMILYFQVRTYNIYQVYIYILDQGAQGDLCPRERGSSRTISLNLFFFSFFHGINCCCKGDLQYFHTGVRVFPPAWHFLFRSHFSDLSVTCMVQVSSQRL